MINLLLSLLVILTGGLLSPTPPPPAAKGPSPAVVVRPTTVRSGKPTSVVILALPRGVSHVQLIADGTAWPTRPTANHGFTAHPTPQNPGPWELDVRYRLHGKTQTVLGTVVPVR